MSEAERAARAAARRQRARLVKGVVGQPEHDFDPVVGAAAISLATRLSRESWAMSGRAWPAYGRDSIPCRFVRRSAP